ncbi:MAG: gfo/Idh/MocA family oxidoreductase, partial [Verrucomicrobiales bacterium]
MKWRVAGINFDHFHMGDLLRMVQEHPDAEIVGIADEDASRLQVPARELCLPADRVYSDIE